MSYIKKDADGYDMKILEGRRQFVFDSWRVLAAYAYSGYLQQGRGAVVVGGDIQAPDSELPKWVTPGVAGQLNKELADMIAQYDPEDEIVVVFELRGFAVTFGRYGVDDYPPPQVYADLWAGEKEH